MNKFFFRKLSGAGNDFILFDKKINQELELTPQKIKELCSRRTGIGADGILIIEGKNDYDFGLQYFNADGSTGSLCANGARCALLYAQDAGYAKENNIKFTQNGNAYSGSVLGKELVRFNLNDPSKQKFNFKIKVAGQLINSSFVNTGSPHVVVNINDVLSDPAKPGSFFDDINDFPMYDLGYEIRNHQDFAPEGTNVNFIKIKDGEIFIRSFERGVENETLACGTGSVASAIVANKNYGLKSPVKLNVKSGDQLIVDFENADRDYKNVSLTGPAKIVFTGEITL